MRVENYAPAMLLFTIVLATGCVTPGSREPDRYFVLEAASEFGVGKHSNVAVHVERMSAATFYNTQNMVYSREPGTRAYYQYNHWTEPPQQAIHAQLASRFPAAGPDGKLVLSTHLEEIYHEAANPPGTAHIEVSAELKNSGGEILATRQFKSAAPAASYDASGAVQGFDRALAELLIDVVTWVNTQASPGET